MEKHLEKDMHDIKVHMEKDAALFCDLFKKKDIHKLVEHHYTKDAKVMIPGKPKVEGRAAIHDRLQDLNSHGIHVEIKHEEVHGSKEHPWQLGTYIKRDIKGAEVDVGHFLSLHKKEADGEFRAEVVMFSSDIHGFEHEHEHDHVKKTDKHEHHEHVKKTEKHEHEKKVKK